MKYPGQNKMHIVCLLDGKPGHEKQTFGIIKALKKQIPVRVTKIQVPPRSFWNTFKGMICLNLPCSHLRQQELVNPHLLITTGSQTHLQALLYKKKHTIPAITCMAPDRIYRSRFDLCFVPVHDGFVQKGNIVNTIGPPNCSTNRAHHKEKKGLILVGGIDNKSHSWNSSDIVENIKAIIKQESGTEWLISSSPRTPEDTVLMLEEVALIYPQVSFYNYKDTPPGWLEKHYDSSAVVWVTADSVSMVFEALTAGCKVGIIPVVWRKKFNKFQKSVTYLEENDFVLLYDAWAGQNRTWSEHDNINEAQRCADIIIGRWWQKNL